MPDSANSTISVSFVPIPSAERAWFVTERGEQNGVVVERNALRMVLQKEVGWRLHSHLSSGAFCIFFFF